MTCQHLRHQHIHHHVTPLLVRHHSRHQPVRPQHFRHSCHPHFSCCAKCVSRSVLPSGLDSDCLRSSAMQCHRLYCILQIDCRLVYSMVSSIRCHPILATPFKDKHMANCLLRHWATSICSNISILAKPIPTH